MHERTSNASIQRMYSTIVGALGFARSLDNSENQSLCPMYLAIKVITCLFTPRRVYHSISSHRQTDTRPAPILCTSPRYLFTLPREARNVAFHIFSILREMQSNLKLVIQALRLLQGLELADGVVQAQHQLWIALGSVPDSDADRALFHLFGAENYCQASLAHCSDQLRMRRGGGYSPRMKLYWSSCPFRIFLFRVSELRSVSTWNS